MNESALLEAVKALREVGVLGMLALILIGGFKQWWVFGWHYNRVCDQYEKELADLRSERDEWKGLVISAQVKDRRTPRETA